MSKGEDAGLTCAMSGLTPLTAVAQSKGRFRDLGV